jgi:beta-glucosidase
MKHCRQNPGMFAAVFALAAGMLWPASPLFAAEESCSACAQQVSVSGEFIHRKEDPAIPIEGATGDLAAFQEEITGTNFTVSIAHLPAGKYTVLVGEVETLVSSPGERLFDVVSGATVLAANHDIFASAGGARKVFRIRGVVEHEDDSIAGPLTVSFVARKYNAKFNTFEVRNASDAQVLAFSASELADPFSATASRVPEISEAPIWRDPAQPMQARARDLIRRMSLAEKVAQLQNHAPRISRLGLPAYDYWNEALHGVAGNGVATVFPQAIGIAATWDPELIRQEGSVIGTEGRAKHNEYTARNDGNSKMFSGLTFWSPNINIFRDPRWGRGQETYGEDPFLAGTLGVAFIRGLQGDDPRIMKAMACAKHFAVHSGPEPERHRFNVNPSERDLYETYLPQFEMAVRKGKVGGVMGAYNAVFGVPACASSFLLTDILRKQWGFDGYIVSDCDAIHNIWAARDHHYVPTPEQGAAIAVKAGCNLCCGRDYNALVRAVQKGLITEAEIDNALSHTLWTRFRLGLFDPPEQSPFSKLTIADNDTPEHEALALKMAEESVVLLKNDGLLPLNRSRIKRIAVIGTNAVSVQMLEGNYNGKSARPVTILDGIKQVAGPGIEVVFASGGPLALRKDGSDKPPGPEMFAEAVAAAKSADAVICVGGITARFEGEEMRRANDFAGFLGGDRTSIELPSVQTELLKALKATRKPVVFVNCSGSAMAMPWEVRNVPAILQAWYPGEQGGRAVAGILFGDVNPSGRLPVTFYASSADLPDFSDYSMSNRTYRYFNGKPQFAFGHGLSYTRFDYRNATVASRTAAPGETIKLTFTLRNSGKREGVEVAQVYFRHVNSSMPQPILSLCGFSRVPLNHGESRTVSIEVPVERLRCWDTQSKQYVVEPGRYELLVGAASDNIKLKIPLTVAARKTE